MLKGMREWGRVYANEWMKLLRRRRLWVTLLLGAIVLAGLSYISWSQHKSEIEHNSLAAQEKYLQQEKSRLTDLQKQLKQGVSEEEKTNMVDEMEDLKESIASMEDELDNQRELVSGDWKKILTEENKEIKHDMNETGESDQLEDNYGQEILMLNQYHLDNDIRPLPRWEGSAFSSTSDLLTLTSVIFLPMLVVILVADMVSGETTSGTIKLLLVRPVSRFTILMGKWLVTLSATIVLTLAFCAILLGLQLLLFGSKGADQPQMVGVTYTFEQMILEGENTPQTVATGHYDDAQIIPQYQFILGSIGLVTLAMMAVATITFFASTWFQSDPGDRQREVAPLALLPLSEPGPSLDRRDEHGFGVSHHPGNGIDRSRHLDRHQPVAVHHPFSTKRYFAGLNFPVKNSFCHRFSPLVQTVINTSAK